jgi:O-acetyl-ADP-ribose deacetylase (regulator of RNase III)
MDVLDRIGLVVGDIVDQDTDAIVNAANTTLLGGGGVDGAIHRAAGKELLAECRAIGGCPTGSARITKGYKLKARHVIHTVGPVWGARPADAQKLASAYRETMRLAAAHRIRSIAFPSISTGAYRYPVEQAAPLAIATVVEELRGAAADVVVVRFVLWDERTHAAYESALSAAKLTCP